jgi:hypothetical protein
MMILNDLGNLNPIESNDFTMWCPSIRLDNYKELQESLPEIEIKLINIPHVKNYSQLLNLAIDNTKSEFIIIANDKARPTRESLDKMLFLLKSGFGFVGLYRMGFFGAPISLFNFIGKFDEGFSDGGFEDNDIYLRFREANIGIYLTEEVHYKVGQKSLWEQKNSKTHFKKKWQINSITKKVHRLRICSDKVQGRGDHGFLDWENTQICSIPLENYSNNFSKVLLSYRFVDSSLGLGIFAKVEARVIDIRNLTKNYFELVKIFLWNYKSLVTKKFKRNSRN